MGEGLEWILSASAERVESLVDWMLAEDTMCQSIKRVLAADDARDFWSKRAIEHINESRIEFPWLRDESTAIVIEPGGELQWWNFAGSRANATLANELAQLLHEHVAHDSFTLKFESSTELSQVESALNEIQGRPPVSCVRRSTSGRSTA